MCVVSMVGDYYNEKWKRPYVPYIPQPGYVPPPIDPAEFEKLKQEVKEMKELLRRAKAYDEAHGEPDCEIDEKLDTMRKIAELVGIDLDEVLKSNNS